jgi:hypothetical protein
MEQRITKKAKKNAKEERSAIKGGNEVVEEAGEAYHDIALPLTAGCGSAKPLLKHSVAP